jgi:hypothetical protein
MPLTDQDLLDPRKEDELDPASLAALVAQEPDTAAAATPAAPATMAPVDGLAQLAQLVAARGEHPGLYDQERAYVEANPRQAGWKDVLGAVGAAIAESAGSRGAIDSFHRRKAQAQKAYEAGLESARGIDMGKRPVDHGTAQMLVLGGMSPEAAAEVTQGSPSLTLAKSGMGQLGARYASMDQQAAQKEAALAAKLKMLEDSQQHQRDLETQRQGGRIELKKTIPGKAPGSGGAGGGGGGGMTPEQRQAALAGVFATQANVPRDQALAFLAGNKEGIAPDALERLENFRGQFQLLGHKQQGDVIKANIGREASNPDTVWRANEAKKSDPKALLALKNEIDEKAADIRAARTAWANMSQDAKNAIAKYGGSGSSVSKLIRDMSMSDQDRAYAAELQNLANALIKAQSGAAVSEGEWGRLATRMGFAQSDFDVMNSPATLDNWLKRMTAGVVQLKRNAVGVYGEPLQKLFPQQGAP